MHRYPLTSNQQLVWAEHLLHPDRALYAIAQLVVIDGPVDVSRFRRAFDALVQATDSLRIVFGDERGTPYQEFDPALRHDLAVLDFSDRPDPLANARAWSQREMERPFAPAQPLFTSTLIRLGDARWAWFYRVHHLLFDGASTGILVRRMAKLYDAAAEDEPAVDGFGRFEDVVAAQTAFDRTAAAAEARAYWASRFNEPAERWRICRPAGRPRGTEFLRETRHATAAGVAALDAVARALNPGVAQLGRR